MGGFPLCEESGSALCCCPLLWPIWVEPATKCQAAMGGTQAPLTFKRALPHHKQPGTGPENPCRSSALVAAGLGPCPLGYCSPVLRSFLGFGAPWLRDVTACGAAYLWCRNPHYLSLVTYPHTSTWADAFLCSETYRDIALWLDRSFLIGIAGVAVATPRALALAVSSVTMLWGGGAAPLCSASTDAMPRVGDSLICFTACRVCLCSADSPMVAAGSTPFHR